MSFTHFHPFEPFFNKDTKKVIIGTLPPPRFSKQEPKKEDVLFPYGSKDNHLWKVLARIYDLDLLYDNSKLAVDQRKEFLIKSQIGICDIVESCKRQKVDASDIGMSDIVLRDILGFIKKYKQIDTLVFMGGTSKNSPEYFFKKILKENDIRFEKVSEILPRINSFSFDNRTIKTISVTSPSNAANRSIGANEYYKKRKSEDKNYSTFDFRYEQYKSVFKS